jgi:prepilin-type processing-associated H-X9-DG protein
MSAIKLSAQKLKDVSNLQTIAAAWKEYTVERGNTMNLGQGFGANYTDYGSWFAWSLAGMTPSPDRFYPSKCVLNDPHVYISSGDKYASKVLKEYIAMGVDTSEGTALKDWKPWSVIANADFSSLAKRDLDWLLSYCTIGNLDASIPFATTPLAFTRGLKTDGTWDEKYGLYGSKGGYVVFCDGHVTWFDGSKPVKFLHWNGEQYTTDIRQAVPNVAKFGCGGIKAISTALPNVIVWGNGIGGD